VFIHPVIGFRSWKLDAGRVCLAGRIANVPWEFDKPTEAICQEGFFRKPRAELGAHVSPHFDCTCGLHAYASQEALEANQIATQRSIFGAIIAWGTLIAHEYGFRAKRARPVALAFGPPRPDRNVVDLRRGEWVTLAEKIAENYRVPIVPLEDLTAYAQTFGQSIDPDVLLMFNTSPKRAHK
jgi:hypothetical protein